MNIDRRGLMLPALAIGLLGVVPVFAASADEDAVAKNVEAFRAAQFAANPETLDALCAAELSYSHSDGRVEDKAAIVRFHWVGEQQAVADGKKSATNLHILMNWQKQGADWKLLSRAATKL